MKDLGCGSKFPPWSLCEAQDTQGWFTALLHTEERGIQLQVPLAPNPVIIPVPHFKSPIGLPLVPPATRISCDPGEKKPWHFAGEISWIFRSIPLGVSMVFTSRQVQGVPICADLARTPHSMDIHVPSMSHSFLLSLTCPIYGHSMEQVKERRSWD